MKEIYRSERSEAMADIYKDVMYDYCAILIISILIITTILRRMVKGKVNRSFMEVLVVAWLAVLFDVWARYLDNLGVQQMVTKYAVHMGYLVLSSFAMPFYIAYVVSMTDTWHLFKAKRFLTFLSLLPVFAITAMIVVSPATKWIFYINAECEYTRGRYFSLIYVCTVIYVIYGLIYLGIFREMFRRRYLVPLGIVFAAAIANAVIRFFYPTAVVEMLCMAIGLMFISLMLQRPEERLDMITGLDKMTAYMDDMRHAFRTRKPIHIIMVNITNYASLRELLGYGKCMQVMAGISEYMMRLDKEKKLKAAMYYLGQGKFRYVLEDTLSGHAPDIAEELNRSLKACFVINQMSVNFITNICIADCPEDISDVDTLMAFGDTLQEVPFTGDIMTASELLKRLHYDMMHDMDTIIESALSNKRFEVYYQPIYSVKEKKFHSAEALIRLKDEKYGFISPEVFIPVAEKSGAIHKIGDFVLEQVCAFIASDEYKKLGMSYIEVNLSVVQCMQPKLANHIMEILTRYGVRPEQLNLEITETAASISQQALEDNIKDLTNMGMKFSLDDFGTGYSNMQRIVKLPFDIIKLDRTFTELYDNPKLGIVLTNAINMIKAMKMKIVVEGVETEEMLKLFSELECEYIQGYYFSKPIPREEFVKFIQASS